MSQPASVPGVYRRALRLIPSYVRSPGVQEFLQKEFVATLEGFGASQEVIDELTPNLNDVSYMEEVTQMQVRQQFEKEAGETDPKRIGKLLSEANKQLDAIHKNVIIEKQFFRDAAKEQEVEEALHVHKSG